MRLRMRHTELAMWPSISRPSQVYGVRSAELRRARYRTKIEAQLTTNNTRNVWQGLQQVTRFKQRAAAPSEVIPGLPDQLNSFYCRFDDKNPDPGYRPPLPEDPLLLTPPFTIQVHEIKRMFMRQNTRKASGPDGVSTYMLCGPALCSWLLYSQIFSILAFTNASSLGVLNHRLLSLFLKRQKLRS